MNGRELYGAIYAGEKTDRLPVHGIGGWAEAVQRWRMEGLGPQEAPNAALGLTGDDTMGLPLNLNMVPQFPIRVLAKTPNYVTLVDENGITKKMLRADFDRSGGYMAAAGATSSMSQWLDFPVKDAPTWKAIYEERFRAAAHGRLPADWDEQTADFIERSRTRWVAHFAFPFGGLFSAVRQLMGLEGALFAMFDQGRTVHTIVRDLTDFYLGSFALALPRVRLDQVTFFEDMCATKAPLISPAMFRQFIAPGYRRLIGGLREMNVRQFFIDTDGDARLIIPELMACGFTGCCPCEVNAHMDAGELRAAFPMLSLSGGIDKRAVATGGAAMTAEFARRFETAWRMGRYTPGLDHGAPPDISWANLNDYARLFLAWCESPAGPAAGRQ